MKYKYKEEIKIIKYFILSYFKYNYLKKKI